MASVWKRLQRVNKRAAKFQYTASYHRIDLETSPKWTPHKLSVVWTRRSRRVVTEPLDWEPSLKDPLKGTVIFPVPENHSVAVTLFKDSRTNELEDKDWTFVLEDVSPGGKRRRLAGCAVNMRKYASLEPSQRSLAVNLQPCGRKLRAAVVTLTLHCVLLREGRATDEDMQSLASLLSVNNNSDIAVLDELDEDDYTLSDTSARQMLDFRQQMEEMTQSLTGSDVAATPCSVQSLALDHTPTGGPPPAPPPAGGGEEGGERGGRPDYLANLTKLAKASPNTPTTKQEPPFASTPIKSFNRTEASETTEEEAIFKPVVFKPTPLTKYNLKPLELKINLNSIGLDKNQNGGKESPEDGDKTPVNELDSLFPGKFDRDKTPVAELLEWCQAVTAEYRACRVRDLTHSFRDGLALCAIIHHFRPDLIDYSGLQPDEHLANARAALEASEKLGVAPVLAAADIAAPQPDKLAIMTYLFQLRAHFTGSELQVEQLGNDESESSYLVGRHDTDAALPRDLFTCEIAARRSVRRPPPRQPSTESCQSESTPDKPSSPTAIKDLLLHQSKTILGKVLSPQRETRPASAKWFTDPLHIAASNEPPAVRPEKLMTRKELTDPFGSDEEDDPQPPANVGNNGSNVGSNGINVANNVTNVGSNGANVDNNDGNVASDVTNFDNGVTTSDNNAATPGDVNSNSNGNSNVNNVNSNVNGAGNSEQALGESPALRSAAAPCPADLPRPTPQLLSRHDELKERARQLLEATKREAREKERHRLQKAKEKEETSKEANGGLTNGEISPSKKPLCEAERQAQLRERARKLIADARAGMVSPASPQSPARAAGVVEIISKQSVLDEIAAAGGPGQMDAFLRESPSSPRFHRSDLSPDPLDEDALISDRSGSGSERGRSPLRSFAALVERFTPDKEQNESAEAETEAEPGDWIAQELSALEREQAAIDARAARLEKLLRRVMEGGDSEEESRLMSQWFNLVNKKNALIRRQMQLNILEQEEDLSRRCELLARELRLSLAVDEWRKGPGLKRRERLLLQELLSAVNERDRLVQEMDEQEKAIANDDEIERNLSTVEIQRRNNCILQ